MNILPRQKTVYTCGAACLAAVAKLLCYDTKLHSERIIADYALSHFGKHYLGLADGNEIPDGSIWNIHNPISGIGHYVVVISHNDYSVRFYCPYYANTLELPWHKIIWESGDGAYKRWALKFKLQLPKDAIFVGEDWPEMGLGCGEPNPHWLLRSMTRFLASNCCKENKE